MIPPEGMLQPGRLERNLRVNDYCYDGRNLHQLKYGYSG